MQNLVGGEDLEMTVTRAQFEELSKQIIERAKSVLANLFESSGIAKASIEDVIVVGGCSRVPAIQ